MSRESQRSPAPLGWHTEVFALPDGPYALLRDLIVERTGILFDLPKRGMLADKLSELVAQNGLTSFLDYYYLLRYDDAAEAHWTALMDRLSVPETYFWRQAEQIETLANIVAPTFFATRPDRPLRIWSAACCTGEEPLSIAIALAEAGLLGKYSIEIVGTDASEAMVARARRGSYGDRSFRQMPTGLQEKYFERDGARWSPVAAIRRAVQFGVANLVRPLEVAPYAASDAIFCRNVFIYFPDDVIRRVVNTFVQGMPPDGYLFVGAAESLTRLGVDLELAEVGQAFAYVKEGRRQIVERIRVSRPEAAARVAAPTTKDLGA